MSTPVIFRRAVSIEALEGRRLLSTVLASVGAQPTGPLTGKIVYASGGHGLAANSNGVWSTGRGETIVNGVSTEMVEDLGNYDQLTYYADELFRAGATVVPMRPIGHQLSEAVVDNVNATYTGSWSDSVGAPYYSTNDGDDAVHYRYASSSPTETATAKYTPNIPTTGFYPVYSWVRDGTDRETDQLYRVNHSGGSTEVKVNHQRVGKGWVYLGTYYFRAGQSGSVEISNRSSNTGKVVIADAIRFGNGMGSIERQYTYTVSTNPTVTATIPVTSGSSREDEASIYWVEESAGWTGVDGNGVGTRVSYTNWRSSLTSTDTDANVGAPLRWAEYMNSAPFGQSVFLGFHSNAAGGRGTVGLWNDNTLFPGTATPNQFAWASLTGNEVTKDMVAFGSPPLEYAFYNNTSPTFRRTDFAFGEIRGDTSGYEFDATIVEVAYHDNAFDAAIMRDPVARQRIAQSTAQATIRYFNQFAGDSTPVNFLPEKPTNLRTSVDKNGDVTLNWDASVTSAIFGGAATGYRVYASRDGYSFDGGQFVGGTTLTLAKALIGAGTVYFKVVGVNAGGESPATAVAAVRVGDNRMGRVLIVDGFDRLARTQNATQTIAISGVNSTGNKATPVTIDRVRPREGNSFDYAVQYAQAIANHPSNLGVDTVDNLAVINGNVNLANYQAVIWISGEESTVDKTFNATEQSKVAAYVTGGGKLFVSGSEVAYDLINQGNGASFASGTLHAGYVGDDANTYAASGVAGSLFNGISINFDNGTGGTYNVDYPDRLSPVGGSTAILNYSGGTGGVAATSWKGANGAATIFLGFPFETITSSGVRAAMMRSALDSFGFNTPLAPIVKSGPASPRTAAMMPALPTTQTLLKRDDQSTIAASVLA